MKRLFTILTVVACVFALAGVAFASNRVEVKVTSEPIQQYSPCDKAGGFSLQFDQNTQLVSGDQITIDLPLNVSLCKAIDLVIAPGPVRYDAAVAAAAPAANTGWIGTGFSGLTSIPGTPSPVAGFPYALTDIIPIDDAGDAPAYRSHINAIQTGSANGLIFRVLGSVGSQRVTVYVLGVSGDGTANQTNFFTVAPDDAANGASTFTIRFLDQWTIPAAATVTGGIVTPTTAPDDPAEAAYNFDYPGLWVDVLTDTEATANQKTYLKSASLGDNTFCINVSNYNSETVNVSMDSRGDKYTFIPSNPQVAHILSAANVSYTNCKGFKTGQIKLPTDPQGNTCSVDYETAGGAYCTSTHSNNKVIFTSSTPFDNTVRYKVQVQVLEPAGAYVGYEAVNIVSNKRGSSSNVCDDVTGVGTLTTLGAREAYNATGAMIASPTVPSTCTVSDTAKIKTLVSQTGTNLFPALSENVMYVNLPNFYFDNTVAEGQTLTARVTVMKDPCGVIAQADVLIGTFGCSSTSTSTSTSLTFPYYTGIAASEAWWDGFVVTNLGATAGEVDITLYEADGDIATINDVQVGGYGIYVTLLSSVIDQMTQTAGTGTIGDSPCFIKASCNFSAAGFAMMGDGTQAQGYLAK